MIRRQAVTVPAAGRVVMRGNSGWWISGVLAALFAYMLADAAVRGEWRTVLLAAPWMCTVLLICWGLLIRPCIIVSASTLTVVNVVRTHTLPWREIDDLQVRYQLVVTLSDGSLIRAWGSPTVHPRQGQENDQSALPRSRRFVGVVEAIEHARDELDGVTDQGARRTTTVAWTPLIGLLAAVGLGVLSAQMLI